MARLTNAISRLGIFLFLLSAGTVFAQTTPWVPTSDVTFKTVAISYPNDVKAAVTLLGTTQFANNVKGRAEVTRKNGITEVYIDIGRLPRPSQLGPAAATYVVWAVSPEGQADNLGEFRKRPSDTLDGWLGSDVRVTTRLRTFSLIITAEPYYRVGSPSRLVAVTNQSATGGRFPTVDATISFGGDADIENKIVTPGVAADRKDPKYPSELLQARRAIDIAKYYDADRLAPDMVSDAEDLFRRGEEAYTGGRNNDSADLGDQAIRLADRARKVAVGLKRAETLRRTLSEKDDSLAMLEEQVKAGRAVQDRLTEERRKRQEAEATANDFQTKYNAVIVERDGVKANLDAALRNNEVLRTELADSKKKALEQTALALQERINREFETRNDTRGPVVVLPIGSFTGSSPATLATTANSKLDLLVDYLKMKNNDLVIEAYCNSQKADSPEFKAAQERAQVVMSYLTARGIAQSRIQAFARGTIQPTPPPAKGKGKTPPPQPPAALANQRVELIFIAPAQPNQTGGTN